MIRIYSCEQCANKFTQKGNVTTHIKTVSGNLPGRKFVRAEIYQGGILPGRKFTRTEISQGIYFWRRIFISAQYKLITIFTNDFTPSYIDSIAFKVIFVHQIKSFQQG